VITFSQIKPHFLFNTLAAIIDLCYGNTEAQNALVSFSDYLRANMDAINQKNPISFETELMHIKHYLALEKLRFEERLQVIYNIKVTDFKIPVLSVQPIVENAVHHGLFNKQGSGVIRIRTKETEKEYIITIVDDGVGFDTGILDNSDKAYTGIEDVRNRLESMCAGKLNISSLPGVGTRVNIIIPKGDE